jgi:hypothetical protein
MSVARLHAEGVRCNSQGQRPWIIVHTNLILSAEGAKYAVEIQSHAAPSALNCFPGHLTLAQAVSLRAFGAGLQRNVSMLLWRVPVAFVLEQG